MKFPIFGVSIPLQFNPQKHWQVQKGVFSVIPNVVKLTMKSNHHTMIIYVYRCLEIYIYIYMMNMYWMSIYLKA